jgi:nitrogen fixation protein NifQ
MVAMARADEVIDLVALLLDHADPAAGSRPQIEAMAERVALGCLGDNHLWQDMQLGSRAELSALMGRWFPALVAKNHADMKWKKFLYRQLCEREQILICKSPSCAVCVDRPVCFGPEDA